MREPVNDIEVENVLSAIRKLIVEGRPEPARPPAPPPLLLTPALRVGEGGAPLETLVLSAPVAPAPAAPRLPRATDPERDSIVPAAMAPEPALSLDPPVAPAASAVQASWSSLVTLAQAAALPMPAATPAPEAVPDPDTGPTADEPPTEPESMSARNQEAGPEAETVEGDLSGSLPEPEPELRTAPLDLAASAEVDPAPDSAPDPALAEAVVEPTAFRLDPSEPDLSEPDLSEPEPSVSAGPTTGSDPAPLLRLVVPASSPADTAPPQADGPVEGAPSAPSFAEPASEFLHVEAEAGPAAAAPGPAERPQPFASGPADPDALRALIRDILREEIGPALVAEVLRAELKGELGQRITRNLRKIVKRELLQALASRDGA